MSDVAQRYFEQVTGHALALSRPVPLSGMEVVEALWPLNAVFTPLFARLKTLRYEACFEVDADAAIEADPNGSDWSALPLGALRVLLERQQQMLVMASANEAAGNDAVTFIPHDLPAGHRTAAVALLFLHRMKLPWPVADRSQDAALTAAPPGSGRPH